MAEVKKTPPPATTKVELLYDYFDERENKQHKAGATVELLENDAAQLITWGRAVTPSPSEKAASAEDASASTASSAKK